MQITIGNKLYKNKRNTQKYGEKEVWAFTSVDGKRYDSWIGKWNENWKEGETIEVDEKQVVSREWEGKTYYTIKAPEGARGGFGGHVDLTPVLQGIEKILSADSLTKSGLKIMMGRIKAVEEKVDKLLALGGATVAKKEVTPPAAEPAPVEPAEQDINVEDIPF